MRPRSYALATEASLSYTAASDGCPDGQLITGPTAEFPEVGLEPGAQPAPTGGLGAGGPGGQPHSIRAYLLARPCAAQVVMVQGGSGGRGAGGAGGPGGTRGRGGPGGRGG